MTGRIRGFDGIRALAVLAVFIAHRSPLGFTGLGATGVLTFFALSGYLIVGILHASRLEIEAGTKRRGQAFVHFFKRRTLRIFPIYYLTLAILTVCALVGLSPLGWQWSALPWNAFYATNIYVSYVLNDWQPTIGHAWSLAVEEQFYLLAAPLLLCLRARYHALACGALVILGLAWEAHLMTSGASLVAVRTDSLANFAFLAFGGTVRLLMDGKTLHGAAWLAWIVAVPLAIFGLMPTASPGADAARSLAPFLAGALLVCIAKAQSSLLVIFLETPALVYLGRISYGIYLYHNLFRIPVPFEGLAGNVADTTVNFAATLAIASASWFLIEQPLLTRRKIRLPALNSFGRHRTSEAAG